MPTKSFVEFIEKAGIRKYFKDSRFNPISKTSSMTSPVGVDPVTGELYSTPYSLSDMTPFKITMSDGPGGYLIDKSFSEIKTAYTNGRKVFLDVGDDTLEIVPSVFENPTFFNFSLIYVSQADISAPKYVISKFASIYSDNSINYAVRIISEASITGDYLPLNGGVMQGDIDLGLNKILFEGGVAELAIDPESEIVSIKSGDYYDRLRVAHPVDNDNDVATKKYVDDHSGGRGTGWTSEQIDLLEAVFEKLVYTDVLGGAIAAQLIDSLRGGVVPEEPITIAYDSTTAVISGLASLNTTFSGTTAIIGV